MSNISLKVDGFAGSDIYKIFDDMLSLANKLEIIITCDINGATVMMKPNADLSRAQEMWDETMTSEFKYKHLCFHPKEV